MSKFPLTFSFISKPFMFYRLPITVLAILAGLTLSPGRAFSEASPNSVVRVLAKPNSGFNVSSVEALMKKGDKAASKGDLVKARLFYDEARDVSKKLLKFYRDLSGSFRGLDARIPRDGYKGERGTCCSL